MNDELRIGVVEGASLGEEIVYHRIGQAVSDCVRM